MSIIRSIRTPIMHRAVEANGLVFVGGTIADDTSVSMGDQTRNILGKIAGYLKEAGTDSSRVVSASIFVTDLSKKKEMDAAWTEFFGDNLPTRATVGVADRRWRADRNRGRRAQGLTGQSVLANIPTRVSRSQRCAGTVSLRWCQNRLTMRGGASSGSGIACRNGAWRDWERRSRGSTAMRSDCRTIS